MVIPIVLDRIKGQFVQIMMTCYLQQSIDVQIFLGHVKLFLFRIHLKGE